MTANPIRLFHASSDVTNTFESDKIQIILDPHYNRQRGFSFTVYPSGSVIDGIVGGGGPNGWNNAWDGVWEAKTRIHEAGWTVECKIPFYMFRFSPKDKYIWGLQSRTGN